MRIRETGEGVVLVTFGPRLSSTVIRDHDLRFVELPFCIVDKVGI